MTDQSANSQGLWINNTKLAAAQTSCGLVVLAAPDPGLTSVLSVRRWKKTTLMSGMTDVACIMYHESLDTDKLVIICDRVSESGERMRGHWQNSLDEFRLGMFIAGKLNGRMS